MKKEPKATAELPTLLRVIAGAYDERHHETIKGYYRRSVPLKAESAGTAFDRLCAEATRWWGEPTRCQVRPGDRVCWWPGLGIRVRGQLEVEVLVAAEKA